MKMSWLTLLLAAFTLPCSAALRAAPSWPQFRGPDGQGVAERDRPPSEFGPGTNLLWKAAAPGDVSSPCIWGDRIFLTAFSAGKLETLCLDRRDGHVLWRQTAPAEKIRRAHPMGSPASATPATDGRHVYVYFDSFGLLAYDLAGREQWRKPLPAPNNATGAGTSPMLAGDRLVLNCDQEGGLSFLLAVNCRDGRTLWRTPRPDFIVSWSSGSMGRPRKSSWPAACASWATGSATARNDGPRAGWRFRACVPVRPSAMTSYMCARRGTCGRLENRSDAETKMLIR